jgi:hypothetical protein
MRLQVAGAGGMTINNEQETVVTDTVTLPPEPFHLASGSHSSLAGGACFNELAAVLAGEPFSDAPKCVSPVIRRMGMTLNDRLDDERRQLLRPFALRALGTSGDGRDEERRQMCNEWLLHHALPDLLDKAGREEAAQKLRDLPGDLAVEGVRRAIYEAREEALSARTDAVARLRERIFAEMKKLAVAGAGAGAVAVAVAGAAAGAVAVADAVAVAGAAAGAVAVADAAADAVAGAGAAAAAAAGAGAAAAAAAGADAAADAAADAFNYGNHGWWKMREAVYVAVYAKFKEEIAPQFDDLLLSALDLMDRMLPESPIKLPVIEHADVVCAAPEALAA